MKYKTEGKQLVLRFFEDRADRSFSCFEVYSSLSAFGVGKSSVYRIISDFEKEGKIKRVPNVGGQGGTLPLCIPRQLFGAFALKVPRLRQAYSS